MEGGGNQVSFRIVRFALMLTLLEDFLDFGLEASLILRLDVHAVRLCFDEGDVVADRLPRGLECDGR